MIKVGSVVRKTIPFIIVGILSFCLLGGSCAPSQDFDTFLNSIVKPYRFSIASWELETLLGGEEQSASQKEVEDEPGQVTEYFSLVEEINILKSEIEAVEFGDKQGDLASLEAELSTLEGQRAALEEVVRRIITKQINK